MRRRGLKLQLDEITREDDALADSFAVRDGNFVRGQLEVSRTGVKLHDKQGEYAGLSHTDIETLRVIGKGASSQVKLVRHRSGLLMAIKVISIFEKSKRQQIMSDIAALYEARCPALVGFYGAFHVEGTISIALEYMDQGCLGSVLKMRGALPEPVAAAVTFQALWGLAYLKHERLVHRDVKPQNILCSARGDVKLTDFGISKQLENSIGMAQTFVGTFKYMSPERIQNHPYDHPGDIWSLGIIVLECITGSYPYPECRTQVDVWQTILESPPPLLTSADSAALPADLREFVGCCLDKDPARRVYPEVLLHAPWLRRHNAVDMDSARAIVRSWFSSLGAQAQDEYGRPTGRESAASERWASPPPLAPLAGTQGGGLQAAQVAATEATNADAMYD